jgi:hypothetical protein
VVVTASAVSVRSCAAESIVVMCGVPQGQVQTPVPSDGARSGSGHTGKAGTEPAQGGSGPRRASPRKPSPQSAPMRRRPLAGLRTRGHGPRGPPTHRFPVAVDQCIQTGSFPLTAAGQFRIRTGFPIKSDGQSRLSGHQRAHHIADRVQGQHKMLGPLQRPDRLRNGARRGCEERLHNRILQATINSLPRSLMHRQARCHHPSRCRIMH